MITSQDETWGGREAGTRKSGQKGKSKKKKKPQFWWQFNPRLISLSLSLPASTHQSVCPLSWFQLYSDKSTSPWRAQRIKWHHLPIALGIRVWGWRVGIVSSIYGWDSKGTGLFCGWWQVPGSGWGRQSWAEARFLLCVLSMKTGCFSKHSHPLSPVPKIRLEPGNLAILRSTQHIMMMSKFPKTICITMK